MDGLPVRTTRRMSRLSLRPERKRPPWTAGLHPTKRLLLKVRPRMACRIGQGAKCHVRRDLERKKPPWTVGYTIKWHSDVCINWQWTGSAQSLAGPLRIMSAVEMRRAGEVGQDHPAAPLLIESI